MRLEIEGRVVEVDDSFRQLSDEDKQRTVDEIAASFGSRESVGIASQEPGLQQPLTTMGAVAAARPAAELTGAVARNVARVTPGQVAAAVTSPLATARGAIQGAVDFITPTTTGPTIPGSPVQPIEPRQMTFGEMAKPSNLGRGAWAVTRGLASLALAPENIMMAPYIMTGYEMEKIRANPQAYPNVPYAQVLRGEQPTIGAAGRANIRRAITETPSGYVPSAIEAENILASGDERMMRIYGGRDALTALIRRRAAERVLQ